MSSVPDTLTLDPHATTGHARLGVWVRRGILCLIAAICIVALFNVFGQHPSTVRKSSPSGSLSLYAPTAARGGDFVEFRFRINATQTIHDAQLILDQGWGEGVSLNTIEPSPVNETSRDGKFAFDLGTIAQGHTFVLYVQTQINATNVAWHRPQNVELDDGNKPIVRIDRTMTVYP